MGFCRGSLVAVVLTDTHAHLDFPEFEGQLDAVLARASEAGVQRVITIGIDRESCRKSLAIAEKYDNVHVVVGLHPCSVMEAGAMDFLDELPALARHPKVVAIGETGMDYHHLPSRARTVQKEEAVFNALLAGTAEATEAEIADGAMKSAQAEAFKVQLDLAVELGLNVVIHQRDAWQDNLEILRPYTGKVRGVFHCFGGSPDDAAEIAALGHLVSFTGIVTFKNAALVQETVRSVTADGYMAETDCPYLAPVPFRGKTCEPAHVRLTVEKIAALRGETLEKVAADTEQTTRVFFKL
ncbi:MAG: TatD family deoxyribonuclease [Chthoniobacterales bacterium]|nr:TatD family deoxyribonuclease [Chthoniobacterales bacterium]